MARDLKRRRGPVSYKEPSSDEDVSGDSGSDAPSHKKRAAPQRKSARRGASDAQQAPQQHERQAALPAQVASDNQRKVQLRGGRRVSYRESSSDGGSEDGDYLSDEHPAPARRPKAAPTKQPAKKRDRRRPRAIPKAIGAVRRPNTESRHQSQPLPLAKIATDGKVPNWAGLPYHVLLQIFVYASHPLHDENFTPTSSISWLAQTARMCTAFVRPALTALYRNPPIFAVRQNRKTLVQHLISPPSSTFVDYSVMVKRLEIDATRMSKLTDTQNSVSDLAALISSLKTLKEVDILDPYDRPPYRERGRRIRRWHYPDELFVALQQSELRLRSWRWNSNFCEKGPLWMKEVHESTAFQSLREVTLAKYDADTSENSATEDPTTEELIGSALAVLPNLRSLVFESCTALNGRLLSLLPRNLVSLNITNCRDLTSEELQAFLVTHGNFLEGLTLNHNQSLDLAFLVSLKQHAPRLEVLRTDMNYYSSLALSSDNEPLYDHLLAEGDIPTWPSALKVINMEFLRNWTPTAAVAFFQSLIDAAGELPWLQEIVITAIVDIEWRQRAEFRRKWERRFHQVFARRSAAPDPSLVSFRAFRESKGVQKSSEPALRSASADRVEDKEESKEPVPRSSKRAEKWGSQRLRSRRTATGKYEEATSDEEASASEDGSDADDVPFVQGRCHTVVFRVDNSRPQEQIFGEADFLDDEVSGDEDWTGDDVVDDGYAW